MREFALPDIGEGLAEAELLGWLVEVGQEVREGQPIAEVSTDKVTVEIPSPCDGVIASLPWQVRDIIPVGATLAVIETDAPKSGGSHTGTPAATPAAAPAAKFGAALAPKPDATSGAQIQTPARRVIAAPSTRRLARQLGVNLRTLSGSGPGGRILRSDLEGHAAGAGSPAGRAPAGRTASPDPVQAWEFLPLTGVRLTSARRMAQSARTYATATTTFTVHADGLLRLREVLASEDESEQVGTLAMMVRSVAAALARNPRFNARVDEERNGLLVGREVNIAIAVDTEHGLTVPVLRSVQQAPLSRIHARIRELARLAREDRLTRADLEGATFTVSSTGAMERATMVSTTPLINPPQVATLWLSRINVVPRVVDGLLEAGPVLAGSISFDHRFIDGAEATAFINDLTRYLEQPERALV